MSIERPKINQHEIREMFLGYFEEKGHKRIDNSSLMPKNDPTLLIINSGMAPLKRFFIGEDVPESKRMTNIQKCVRTNDIESIGDTRHLTFFEMMGNWSIGDYFKKEALGFAWELLTEKFKFNKNNLCVTVYGGDPKYPQIEPDYESYNIWREIGIPSNKIYKLGAEHNFWGPPGDSGPCGPSSEVFYDLGKDVGCGTPECGPDCDCGRFIEIWDPGVFMQYNKNIDGHITKLGFNNVDAGAGLERFAMILQNAESVYDTDLLKPITDSILAENNIDINFKNRNKTPIRIMTDHIKSSTFLISDGIYPSNTRREYVTRRLIRRLTSYSKLIGVSDLRINEAVDIIVQEFGQYYPNLVENRTKIIQVIDDEKNKFLKTLNNSEKVLDKILKFSGNKVSGKDAFILQSTHGLPYEILENILKIKGISIDKEEFDLELKKNRENK